ncbi:uracil-DNA glycosylase [Bizionia sediminis]|uniref:Uracil-DNA glycosylase n=1 Tax=Bizionia sediminis TaxID=1737064 RepID=A0ABW5KQU2_9FLAO
MDIKINNSWQPFFAEQKKASYFKELETFINREYANNTCYPQKNEIFKAFETTGLTNIRVVIIGQDPYHGPNQANGLCFSVHEQIAHPPSLRNIFKELEMDLKKPYPQSGDLIAWAKQGVFLLNTILSVRAHEPGSHKNAGWEILTDAAIKIINRKQTPVVFLLWGGFAKKKAKLITNPIHTILTSGHPSPLSANRGFWFGNKHFSETNRVLKNNNQLPIKW